MRGMLFRFGILFLLCVAAATGAMAETVHAPEEPGLTPQQIEGLKRLGMRMARNGLQREVETGKARPVQSSPPKTIASAKVGQTYPISEPEGDVYFLAKLLRKLDEEEPDPRKLARKLYTVKTPVPRTREEQSYKVDLTVTAKKSVYGYDTNMQKVPVIRAGQKINPFQRTAFPWTMWFLDEGDDALFDKAMHTPLSIIIVTNGNLLEIWRKHRGIRLFKATKQMMQRFVIRSVPAKAWKCDGEDLLCVQTLKGHGA